MVVAHRAPARHDVEQIFWTDADGPVGAVLATEFRGTWQCSHPSSPRVRQSRRRSCGSGRSSRLASLGPRLLRGAGPRRPPDLVAFLRASGFVAGEPSAIAWLDARDRPAVTAPAEGFVLTDRAARAGTPHPMRGRNGDAVEDRLRQCSLYDPALDLAVEAPDGTVAGYSLYWFDPVTRVGLLEPMRVNDEYQRRGLARAMLTAGLDRLAQRGATRLKVGYSTDIAGALYAGSGFRRTSTTTWYRAGGSED